MQIARPCMLFVHAHPDDETITTGATIAHYAARGVDVHLVTCTLGEEGEVIGDRWAQLAADSADQLGGYRIAELCSAVHLLGIGDPIFLGGAGHWRDSGMVGTEPKSRQQRFVDADEHEAVGALVEIVRELRPHVVVTYDPNGGYGHPDHIRAHQITTAAVAAAATDEYPGEPWQVAKFYWTVMSKSAIQEAISALDDEDILPHWDVPPADIDFGLEDDQITAMVDAIEGLDAKIEALGAHITQVTVGPTGRAAALSNNLALPVLGSEYYVLASGVAGDRDERGWETDLFAGLSDAQR